jgi:hypothetical protein
MSLDWGMIWGGSIESQMAVEQDRVAMEHLTLGRVWAIPPGQNYASPRMSGRGTYPIRRRRSWTDPGCLDPTEVSFGTVWLYKPHWLE